MQASVLEQELMATRKEYLEKREQLERKVQNLEKALQEEQTGGSAAKDVQRLLSELDRCQAELKNGTIERERLQAQLEMLVQELERNQVTL